MRDTVRPWAAPTPLGGYRMANGICTGGIRANLPALALNRYHAAGHCPNLRRRNCSAHAPIAGFSPHRRNPIVGPGILNLRLAKAAAVRMEIFDVAGRSVKILHNGQFTAGQHELRWDTQDERGLDLPSGLYFVRVRVGEANQVRKIVLLQ